MWTLIVRCSLSPSRPRLKFRIIHGILHTVFPLAIFGMVLDIDRTFPAVSEHVKLRHCYFVVDPPTVVSIS